MAVYERGYRRYVGPLTPAWSRFLVVTRYALSDAFQSKRLIAYCVVALVVPLGLAGWIYVVNSIELLQLLDLPADLLAVDVQLFEIFLRIQGAGFAFILALLVGPGLIARDLANNGLPLYLARPFSRAEYVGGKLLALAAMMSAITWVPGLLLFMIQSNLVGVRWLIDNFRIAAALFVGSWLWILALSLLTLALSAWVRWRTAAAFILLAIYLAGGLFAGMIELLFRTPWGQLLHLRRLIQVVWSGLFGTAEAGPPPVWAAVVMLALVSVVSLWLLRIKVRAYEVVR